MAAIILMYVFFPILRKGLIKKPILTWIIVLVIYIWFLYGYNYNFNVAKIIFTRFPEIMFGMSFTYRKAKVNWKVAVAAFVLLVINGIVKPGVHGKFADNICRCFIFYGFGIHILFCTT